MTKKAIYLAGAMLGCTDEEMKGWREQAKSLLQADCLDPTERDYRGRELECAAEIVEQDKADIDRADALLVYHDRPSVGTSMEVFYAWERARPLFTVVPPGVKVSPWLAYHSRVLFPTLKQACEHINTWDGQPALEDLLARKKAFIAARKDIERRASSHPEKISTYFPGIDHPLLKRVTFVREVKGWTDSRKNACPWNGFEFVLDGEEYVCRHGSNWCSNFTDVANIKSDKEQDLYIDDWPEDNPIEELLEEDNEPHKVVALALLVLNGVI